MNVQIFGTKKSFDTKKAQRYFKERRIKVQFIDLKEKEMSKGELTSVMQAVGGIDKLLNPKAKDEETLALIQHLTPSQRFDKLLENQQVLAEPIVRNVADLLDDLIEQSVQLVGTPVTLMTKDDKVRAIRYLNDTGAFLITKSGPKVCKYFGISKYTLYNYLDEAKSASAASAE